MTFPDFPSAWMPIVDIVAKATIVLGAAAVATYTLRRASAALRHLIWTLALVSALLMPALSLALPRWQLPIVELSTASPVAVAAPENAGPVASPELAPRRVPGQLAVKTAASETAPAESPRAATSAFPSWLTGLAGLSWPRSLFALWALGVSLIVARVIVGMAAVQWMARRGQRVLDAPWMKMAIALASEVGVSSNITFLRSPRATMPMACGVLRPAVMMPVEADEWPVERLRIVLLHELAHVKRHDCLTHLLAQLACACHWFNPLAWVAARQLRTERERACDDLVLSAGTRGPDYADQLLEIARDMRCERYPALLSGAGLAMAHRSQLEGRLMAILDPRVPHSTLTRVRAAAASVVCCAAVIPLAAVQPWHAGVSDAPVAIVDDSTPQTPAPSSTRPAPSPSSAVRPTGSTPSVVAGQGVAAGRESASEQSTKQAVSAVIAAVNGALDTKAIDPTDDDNENEDDQNRENETQDSKPVSGKRDPRMVAALTAAMKDTDKEVRETALQALAQMRDPAVYEPLVQALKDAAPSVREHAAFGLGQLRDRRAVEPLATALKDEHVSVREQAAFALSQLKDRAAIPALAAALKDTSADVREQVIYALSQFKDPATIDAFAQAIKDGNGNVREKAAFALGQLGDRRAVEPLISALKDADADVREQAAFALGQLRDRGAVEALVIALKDTSASVREQVAFALGQIGDPRAIDGLTAALKDTQPGVRRQAAFALGQLAR